MVSFAHPTSNSAQNKVAQRAFFHDTSMKFSTMRKEKQLSPRLAPRREVASTSQGKPDHIARLLPQLSEIKRNAVTLARSKDEHRVVG